MCPISASTISGTTSLPNCCARPETSAGGDKALNHADIKTTARYAHVLDEEVAEGIERIAKSRTLSRTSSRKVG